MTDQTKTAQDALLTMLKEDGKVVLYRPRLSRMVGTTSAILLQQMYYRYNGKPFYKLKAPCSSRLYTVGDSWCEELGFLSGEFDTALRRISTKCTKGKNKTELLDKCPDIPQPISTETKKQYMKRLADVLKYLIIFWTDSDHVTWYSLNRDLFAKLLIAIYIDKLDCAIHGLNGESQFIFIIDSKNTNKEKDSVATKSSGDAVAADNGEIGHSECPDCGMAISLDEMGTCYNCNRGGPAIELDSDGRLTEESWKLLDDTTDARWLEQHAVDADGWGQYTHLATMGILQCSECKSIIGDTDNPGGKYFSRWLSDKPWTPLCPGCWLKRDDTPLAFEHGNCDDNHKVPTFIIVDKVRYTAERTDHGHIMQLMLRCNCEVGFGDDTDFVVHTLYATEAKGEENISVCLMCNTLIYGRGHSKHSTAPTLTAEQAQVLERIRRGEFLMSSVDMRVELCHYLLDTELIIVNTIIDVDEPMYLITLAGHAALEAWQAKQKPTIEELDDKILVPTPDECSATEQTQHCACGTEITGPANYRAAIDDDDIELVALCDSCEATAAADYKARIDATLKLTESCDSKQLEADEPPPKPKSTKAKKPPTPHTLMKNALVTAMGYKQDDITTWGEYNKASKMLRDGGASPDDMMGLYNFTTKAQLKGGWEFKSPVAMATRWPEYQKQLRTQHARQPEEESKPLSATDGVIRSMK